MIPRSDIEIVVDADVNGACAVDASAIVEGVACIHGYDPGFYAAARWDAASFMASAEAEELRLIDARAEDADAFDELAFEAENEMVLEFELGINAAAEALCAAGCPTFASCRGHHNDSSRSDHPWILFAADPPQLELVSAAARAAGCGLDIDHRGLLILYGSSVKETVGFASRVVAQQAAFDALEPMVPQEDARPEGDDFEW